MANLLYLPNFLAPFQPQQTGQFSVSKPPYKHNSLKQQNPKQMYAPYCLKLLTCQLVDTKSVLIQLFLPFQNA